MQKVKICDTIMGGGKTSAAITYIKEHKCDKFIFITPYLDQVKRIKTECAEMKFYSPHVTGNENTKKESWHKLIVAGKNIVTTHQLFLRATTDTESLLKDKGYILIIDESLNVLKKSSMNKYDVELLVAGGYLNVDNQGNLCRTDKRYKGIIGRDFVSQLKELESTKQNIKDLGVSAILRAQLCNCFKEIILLTYMFDAQFLKYYFDINDIEYRYIGVKKEFGVYRFVDSVVGAAIPEDVLNLRNKIHIYNGDKVNAIGDKRTALSASWYIKGKAEKCERIKKNLRNVFSNVYKAKSEDVIWTTFKSVKDLCAADGCRKSFLSCNARATNDFADRHYVAYCINIFYNPFLINYMHRRGIELNSDRYALSEMLQFIFRSAIRKGEDIWIYVPSSRMRGLLQAWLDGLNSGKGVYPTEEQMKKIDVIIPEDSDEDFEDFQNMEFEYDM